MTHTRPSDFTALQTVLATIDSCQTARQVVNELASFIEQFGFTTVGLGHIINPARHSPDSRQVFQLSNWKPEWSRYWAKNHLIIRDPVARYALTHKRPFRWREAFDHPLTRNHHIEKLMRDAGFSHGVAIPVETGQTRQLGIVSLGADRDDVSPETMSFLELACIHAYVRIEQLYGAFLYQATASLTPRQIDVLQYAAGGKSNETIGSILSISGNSVRDHIRDASDRLGTSGRTHTIAVAIYLGLIIP